MSIVKNYCDLSSIIGKTMIAVVTNPDKDELGFTTEDGEMFLMFHDQDCCENVYIEDIDADLSVLIGHPILQAEESSNRNDIEYGTETWTFYKISTVKGAVKIRWYGSSNGYYSEGVSFARVTVVAEN